MENPGHCGEVADIQSGAVGGDLTVWYCTLKSKQAIKQTNELMNERMHYLSKKETSNKQTWKATN